MPCSLLKKSKTVIVSFRFSILTIFMSLFITSLLTIILVNHLFASDALVFTAKKLMRQSSTYLYKEFSEELQTAEKDNSLTAQLLEENIIQFNNIQQIVKYTYALANRFYLVQAAYWVSTNGDFVITKYEENDTLTTIIHETGKEKLSIYHDINGKVIKTEKSNIVYDPRVRPWFLAAKQQKKTIWTDIYLFAPNPYLGITVATPVFKNNNLIGVFGLDIRLDWLSWYVGQQKISKNSSVFIVNSTGKIIAFPGIDKLQDKTKLLNIDELKKPWITESFNLYKKTSKKEFNFDYQNNNYLAVYQPIPNIARQTWTIGIVAPRNDFISELITSGLVNIGVGLLVLILGIIIISALVSRIIRPLRKLVKQTERIKNFKLDDVEKVQSNIKEVMLLSDSLYSMKSGLKSFQQYVPASLVRQLIENAQEARIGGSKRELVVLFTDIKNFTTIAETTKPDELMEDVCQYFDILTKFIIEEKGTIDKYIGDSVMAFWGAPVSVKQPYYRAAITTLKCLKEINQLNYDRAKNGKNKLITRFGIHRGVAIVGNVGSSERMNYTALGDTINFASRLESLNKIYKTNILVSEDVYTMIKNEFILRLVDYVAVKGKQQAKYIYELLAKNKNELSFDVDQYNLIFKQAFSAYQSQQWDHAIKLFHDCQLLYPQDKLTPHFIKRCQKLKSSRPKDWNGAWKFTKK